MTLAKLSSRFFEIWLLIQPQNLKWCAFVANGILLQMALTVKNNFVISQVTFLFVLVLIYLPRENNATLLTHLVEKYLSAVDTSSPQFIYAK